MKRLLLTPNMNPEFSIGGATSTTQFLDYSSDSFSIDLACAGTNSATSFQIPQLLDSLTNPMAFNISITAKYVNSSNFCFTLPAFSSGTTFPVFFTVAAYLHQALPGTLPSVTIFLPIIGGVQSTFYDGTSSINVTVGSIIKISYLGFNLTSPFPRLWAHS